MGIDEFLEKMNKKSRYKWNHLETVPLGNIGVCHKIIGENDCGFYSDFRVSSEALESLPFEKLYLYFNSEMIEHERNWIFRMFWKMTPSMKKALVDIMQVQIKEDFDELNNIGDKK